MTPRFVLIPGAGGAAWYWHRVVPLLEAAGHEAVPVDLPGSDETTGLAAYARLTRHTIGGHPDAVLVAQSLGGFTAAQVAAVTPLRALVFVNAMIPVPGETPGDWWEATAWEPARLTAARRHGYATDFDLSVYFLHDVDPEVAAAGEPHKRPEASAVSTRRATSRPGRTCRSG
jgi:pimeloyl-ACP methyl ester carboxylesterase